MFGTSSMTKSLGIIAMLFSLYRGTTTPIPVDDLLLILGAALALMWFGHDLEKRKARKKELIKDKDWGIGGITALQIGKALGV